MSFDRFPRQPLGFFPTPTVELPTLRQVLAGPRLLMKRDDLTGLALGGNKTRKLEYLIGDALARGADTVVTAGAAQSNHCRQTAAAAASCGLECHLVLGGEEPPQFTGNLLLDRLFDCEIHWAGRTRKGEDLPRIVEHLKALGKRPYLVPYGGSNELGAYAFVEALKELDAQIGGDSITHIVFASSSGGTHAGLMVGRALLGRTYRIVGINIDKDETGPVPFGEHILELANRTAELIGLDHRFVQEDVNLESGYVGDGYGVLGALEREAISLVAKSEGILLDPVYTGRAMGGLIDMIRAGAIGRDDEVLFWHTGGAPALFAYGDDILA